MRMALVTAPKGTSSIADYFTKMKGLANEMASAGRKLEDAELISYILTVLDLEHNPIISAVTAMDEPITVGELFTQLVNFEQRVELHGGGPHSSASMAAKGGRGGGNHGGGRGRGGGGGRDSFGHGQKGAHGGSRGGGPAVIC